MGTLAEQHLKVKQVESILVKFKTKCVVFPKESVECGTMFDIFNIQKLNTIDPNWSTSVVWNGLNEATILAVFPQSGHINAPIKLVKIQYTPVDPPKPTTSTEVSTTKPIKTFNPDIVLGEIDKMVDKVKLFRKECDTVYRTFFLTRARCRVCSLQVVSCDSFCDPCYMYLSRKTDLCLACLKPGRSTDRFSIYCSTCSNSFNGTHGLQLFSYKSDKDYPLYQRIGTGMYQVYGFSPSKPLKRRYCWWRPTIYNYKKFIKVVQVCQVTQNTQNTEKLPTEKVSGHEHYEDMLNKTLYYSVMSEIGL